MCSRAADCGSLTFSNNDPMAMIDLFGLASGVAAPALRHALPPRERCCCDETMVKLGEKTLQSRYGEAVSEAKALGITPSWPPPYGSGRASCKNSSMDVLDYLVPTPRCWQCYLEERNHYKPAEDPKDERLDHQVVICVGYYRDGR